MFISVFLLLFFIFPRISSEKILKYTIEEKSPVNTLVMDFSKTMKSNGSYQIYALSPVNQNLFSIDKQTGQLIIRSMIDRDEMCINKQCSCHSCEILLQLLVENIDRIHSQIIEITIKDRNDHSPNFEQQSMIHLIHIKDNVPLGYRIVLPSANDPDEGLNSVQSYRLEGNHAEEFDIDFSSFDIPYLIVRSSLDHQRQSSYSLTLIALDHGQPRRSNSIQLNIQICNSSTSIPTFPQSVYSIDIREDTLIGTTVLKIEAMNDNQNKIFYEFLMDSPFIIDRLTGQIQLSQKLDYEREKTYRLTVKAYENTIPTYASIFIRILDINDNPAIMTIKAEGNTTLKQQENENYVLSLDENTPIGTTIAHVILNDLDSSANGNPYLQLRTSEPPLVLIYKLIYQNAFQNTKFYSLIINQNLDRESKSIYNNLQLIAHDSGTPTLHTQLNLILNLTDVNDCTPKFLTNSTIYHIDENNPVGYQIGRLLAVDDDLGANGQIKYRILNETDLLLIDPKTGEMSLNQSIDFESLNTRQLKNLTSIDLEFLIEIHDHGTPILSNQMKITLRIHDLNDHTPEFNRNQTYHWTYSPNQFQPNSVLGQINAIDHDSGLAGLVHYSIRALNPCLTLDITSLGYVYIPADSSIFTCSVPILTFEIIASDYDSNASRSSTQLLNIDLQTNSSEKDLRPKLLPLSIERTTVDMHSQGNIAFILDLSTLNNRTYQPRLFLHNLHSFSCWNVNPTGEIRLISHPFASTYILSLTIIDEYTNENSSIQLRIDICNSSILNSCQTTSFADNRTVLIYAISLALIITLICIMIFSMIICLCCRKSQGKKEILSSTHQQSFLQCNDDYHERYKSSSNSIMRDDDRDSACIINGNSSSSTSSSSGMTNKNDIWSNQKDSTHQMHPTASTYYYDLKLAEFLRKNQHPLCVHLNDLPPIPQSFSTDYGFSSLELSESSSTSTLPHQHRQIEISVDQSPERQFNIKSFISSRECVV